MAPARGGGSALTAQPSLPVTDVSAAQGLGGRVLASCASVSSPALHGLLAAPHYQELPSKALDAVRVEALWRYAAPEPCEQRILPDGRMDLVAHALCSPEGRLQRVWLAIAGPADRWSRVPVQAGMLSLGVRFCIGWGGLCLGVSPTALRNQVWVGTPVQAHLGPLVQGVLAARTPAELQHALESAAAGLVARAATGAAQRRALQAIGLLMQGQGCPHNRAPRSEAAARALRRDVQQTAGLSLRTLAGVLRFQQAVALLNARAAPSLAELASAAGYADQAHMTREFRRFGGFTPALPQSVPVLGAAAPVCVD